MEPVDVRAEYDELKSRFGRTDLREFTSGGWIGGVVQRALDGDRRRIDRAWLAKTYGAQTTESLAESVIRRSCRRASLASALSASAVTAAEASALVTGLLDLPIVAPTVAASIMADVAYTTMLQIHATYELSVVHGAPLSPDDADDCYVVLMSALGIEMGEADQHEGGKRAAAHHAQRVLTKQGRKIIGAVVKKTASKQIAKRMTERTVLRVLAPGISIPISAALSWRSTRSTLGFAEKQMRRRAAVVHPLIALFARAPECPRALVLASLEALMAAPLRGDWSQGQKDALRHTRGVLGSNGDADATEADFDARVARVGDDVAALTPAARDALFDYLACAASLDDAASHDEDYALVLGPIATRSGTAFDRARIEASRRRLS
jgi:hypothetical protein